MPITQIELPQPALEEKWRTAESNLIYFVICGIACVKSLGESPENFGSFAGQVADSAWEDEAKGKGSQALIEGISWNKHQFRNFQMEILSESEKAVEARMKGFGEDAIKE